jgi:hypothetical protein
MFVHAVPMTLAADGTHVAVPSVLIILLIGAVIYTFGYARAVMHRANTDYKTTKAAVPVLRKAFWKAFVAALKVGGVIAVVVLVLSMWVYGEIKGGKAGAGDSRPSPSSSAHPNPRHSNG